MDTPCDYCGSPSVDVVPVGYVAVAVCAHCAERADREDEDRAREIKAEQRAERLDLE